MKKIILDTDIGSDIDDALCLAYLLMQPECELLGITTVTGEGKKRAMLASAICKHAKKNIPIFVGTEKPLIIEELQPIASQATKLNNWEHDVEFPNYTAIEFMRKTIHENPNEISLLGIGPLTNIGLLFAIDPKIPSLLKELVLMCGKFSAQDYVEWNAKCDPYAAAIVYGADIKNFYSVGLDVTTQVIIKKEDLKDKLDFEILKPVKNFAEVWFEGTKDEIVFHDPLAAAVMFEDRICSFEDGNVHIELQNIDFFGGTKFESTVDGKHKVAAIVDRELFFEHYFNIISGEN